MIINNAKPTGIDNVVSLVTDTGEILATVSKYGQGLISHDNLTYRPWSPGTSKLSSMILKGMKIPLAMDSDVLYLGAASGTTVSHVSDIATEGVVYAVEFSARPARDLVRMAAERVNIIPVIADARYPDQYPPFIDHVDVIYQDVAQPDQAGILIANAEKYLVKGGYALIAIKARSISLTESPSTVFEKEIEKMSSTFDIIKKVSLEPLHHDHMAVICKY